MNTKPYMLEIYYPGSVEEAWVSYESDNLLPSIHSGDFLNPGLWEGSQSPMVILRVASVEHILWDYQGTMKHKLMVFSEEIDNSPEIHF